MFKSSIWTRFWGILDLTFFIRFVLLQIYAHEIPFLTDLITAQRTSIAYGSDMPELLAAVSILFYLSLIVSGILLLTCNKYGKYLAWAQAVPRFIFFAPSLFPVILILIRFTKIFWLVMIAMIVSEALKLYMLHKSKCWT